MARRPKPWFRKSRKSWFVTVGGTQHCLGSNKREAFDRFYQLMQQPKERAVVVSESLAAVFDKFLDWVFKNRSPDTYEWYRSRLQRFIKLHPLIRVSDLKPFHVQEWVDSHSGHSPMTKRNNIRAIKRSLRWAAQQGHIKFNPIADLPAPSAKRRETVVTPDEFATILSYVQDQAFRDLLTITYQSGCRLRQ